MTDLRRTRSTLPARALHSDRDAELRRLIRDVRDFPRSGILFKDITPLLSDPRALASAVEALAELARPLRADCVAAPEARGFLLGPALAVALGAGFVPVRKTGKLPRPTVDSKYELEYGTGRLEVHRDALSGRGGRVLVHDDLLATGGTAAAVCELVERLGGHVVGCCFLIELSALDGRRALAPHEVRAVMNFHG